MSLNIDTTLTQMLGIQHPVVLAPMAMVSGGELAAAVSSAGGLGLIGGGYGDEQVLEQQFALAGTAPVGVGFISWSLAQQPGLLDMALAHKPIAVMLSFGEIDAFVGKIKAAGSCLIVQVQSLHQAVTAHALGADVIVAQGTEAGGHGASRATFPLVPAVVDALPQNTPVIAAGGVADGRGLAASLMLGASGVMMGSRFYASKESLAPAQAQQLALRSGGDNTTRSSVFDKLRGLDWPSPYTLRSLDNQATQRWQHDFSSLSKDIDTQRELFQQAVAEKNYNEAPVIVGEAVDLIREVLTAESIVQQCVEEAIACVQQPAHFKIFSR